MICDLLSFPESGEDAAGQDDAGKLHLQPFIQIQQSVYMYIFQ